jgi:NAD(P)-dependent dehydrogenase (short-subunit alcohol dehydrogenase family)
LIINAAIGDSEQLASTTSSRLSEYLNANVVGPLRVVNAFLPALRARKTRKVVLISSVSGSIDTQIKSPEGSFGGPYAVTKGAVNMLAVQYHNELHDSEGFIILPIRTSIFPCHPVSIQLTYPTFYR